MKQIKYNGFQEKLKLQKEIELECKQEKQNLSMVDNKTYPEYMLEYNRIKSIQIKKIKNQTKVDEFEYFLSNLPQFAEDNDYDITVDFSDDELDITITIVTDFIYGDISTNVGISSVKFLNALFSTYPNYIISAKDSVMTFSFLIQLYDEEDTGEHDDTLLQMENIMKAIFAKDVE